MKKITDKTIIGNIGMLEVALYLSRDGQRVTVHGGQCAFDLTDGAGNRYEVKTATASMKDDYDHAPYRGWVFASNSRARNIAKFEYTVYVLLSEEREVEKILCIPLSEDRFRNGCSAIIKDTAYQRKHSPRPDLVGEKWYDKFMI